MRSLSKAMAPIFGGAFAVLLAACNPVANLNAGEDEIADFHRLYEAGDFDLIYREAAPELKEVTSAQQWNELLELVDLRLGDVEATERADFNVNSNQGGTFTTILMATRFEQGEGTETFTFIGHGDEIKLVGYHVSSQRLVFSPDEVPMMAEQAAEIEAAD